ncbi:carbohydrate ABC transporter permease [Deinococcus marmoris]|uniref:carbohydrate ABC transporter permease n=1 Tax=Deinococcus marmoris TaxID=249408 RepID=UPI000495900C|nr:sugar ABC transporter permease [Deinococcus marmoris]
MTPIQPLRGRSRPGVLTGAWRSRAAYLFILPTFLFLAYFAYYPVYLALTGAFTNWDGFLQRDYVGLDNFKRALTDPVSGIAVKNNLIWMGFGLILSIVPAFFIAELIFHLRRPSHQRGFRTLFIAPIIIPALVNILLWTYFYRGDGLINQLLDSAGLDGFKRLWLADPKIALYSLIFMGFPWINAFNMLILYTGLQGISSEVLEAARLDGATGLNRIWRIDLPLITPQLTLILLLEVVAFLQNLLTPRVMTNGGPGYSTVVPALQMYQAAIDYGEFGYSMAISVLLFMVVVSLTVLARVIAARREREANRA